MMQTTVTVLAAAVWILGSLVATAPQAKPTEQADRWETWRPLVGTWEGASEGEPGKGTVKLEVGFVLNERFLKLSTIGDYLNAKGKADHHEDFGFVSFDSGRKKFIFRQFHAEGFVNHYTLTSDPKADQKLQLTSESCENTPSGWRARETYRISNNTLEHTFELAAPNRPFERYIAATLKRVKQ
jgi:hypothetical protein